MPKKYQGNIWKLTLSMMTNNESFSIGVSVLYMLYLGLDLGQVSLVVSAWLIFSTIGNIPAGILADRFGNKLALVLGGIFFLVGAIFFAWARDFYWLFTGYALMGFGSALKQGADQALLYNSLQSDGDAGRFKAVFGRIELINNLLTGVVMSLIGAWLYMFNPRWPFIAEVVLAGLSLMVTWFLLESKRKKLESSLVANLLASLVKAFTKPNFSRIFIFSALIGSVALTTIQYAQPLYKNIGIATSYFGLMAALMFVFRGLGAWFSDKLGRMFSVDKYLVLHAAVFGLFLILLQETGNYVFVVLIMAIFFFLRGLYAPTISTWINEKINSGERATMLSINSQILTLLTAFTLYLTGRVVAIYDLNMVFYTLGIISLLLLIAYVLAVRKVEAK